MGSLHAVFKADEAETRERYCVSEWWLRPHTHGPGAHLHDNNDEVFYVLEGRPEIFVGEEWVSLERGAFVLIPQGIMHDFRNATDEDAGLLNFFTPGGFSGKCLQSSNGLPKTAKSPTARIVTSGQQNTGTNAHV